MKRRYAVIALPVLVCGAAFAGSSQASARDIDPADDYRPVVVVDGPGQATEDRQLTEVLQTSAAALGGAGLAIVCPWLYRRRHPLPAH